jgi:phosphate transport system substrate-binding protein
MLASNNGIESSVAGTPGAIGYIGVGFISDKIKVLSIDGVKASVATVKNGTYKLKRFLYMYTPGEPSGLSKQFLDFVLSADGQKIVEEVGYVSVK